MTPARQENELAKPTPYREIYMAFDDVLQTELEMTDSLIRRLRRRGISTKDILYCGVDGALIRESGFGERRTTFAMTLEQMTEAAERNAKYHSMGDEQPPISYAYNGGTPALVLI